MKAGSCAPAMDFDALFHALSAPIRRRLIDELAERGGQTLFELHVRLIGWHGAKLSRQGLSKHLSVLETADLVRIEWRWRSKHHFLTPAPIELAWNLWLGPLVSRDVTEWGCMNQDRTDEHHGR